MEGLMLGVLLDIAIGFGAEGSIGDLTKVKRGIFVDFPSQRQLARFVNYVNSCYGGIVINTDETFAIVYCKDF